MAEGGDEGGRGGRGVMEFQPDCPQHNPYSLYTAALLAALLRTEIQVPLLVAAEGRTQEQTNGHLQLLSLGGLGIWLLLQKKYSKFSSS